MSEPNTVVVKKSLNISVKHKAASTSLSFLQPYFTEIETYYSESKPKPHKGVLNYYSLTDLQTRLNTYISTKQKFEAPAILKGLYQGGTSGQYCVTSSPFLFFDVDVKGEENKTLQDSFINARAFEELKRLAVIVWRSNSQKGIAGILYVPQLEQIGKSETRKHLKIGNAITKHLSAHLANKGLAVSFDVAQNKFRQVRFLAQQREPRELNKEPFTFTYEIEEVDIQSYNGIKQYQFSEPRAVEGSIRDQFNNNNSIDEVMLSCGFKSVQGANRYKHYSTSSTSSGHTDPAKNIFFNHSGSFSHLRVFDPFGLVCYTQHNNDKKVFKEYLKGIGYVHQQPQQITVAKTHEELEKPRLTDKEIFTALFDLRNLPLSEKLELIAERCRNSRERQLYRSYLKVKNLEINYAHHLKIDKYVSEVLAEVLNIADKKGKIILRAETGAGKTSGILRDFKKHRTNARCLILAPLTVIVEQSSSDYDSVIGLTGSSEPIEHSKAKSAQLVFATYEQGAKHLEAGNTFDYVVIDEVHNLFLGNGYKREAIAKLTSLLDDQKVIGLTGTPNNLFNTIGFSLVSVARKEEQRVKILQRIDNREPAKILIQHLDSVTGKAIFRVNSTQTLQEIKTELTTKKGFKDDEVLVLYSSRKVKSGKDYEQIVNNSAFLESVKIVLTTGLIDEGINLKQYGFSDVVFIETEYSPNPEPLKQFFARFRNKDGARINYHYFKKKKNQEPVYWNEAKDYNERLKILKGNKLEDFSSYRALTNDNYFYYEDKSINTYYLAYEVYTKFLTFFNHYEFNYYLETNYNLSISVDELYAQSCVDVADITDRKKAIKKEIAKQLHNNFESLEIAVRRITVDRKLKKRIEDLGQPIEPSLMNFVQANIKKLETYCGYYYQILDAGEPEPLQFLSDGQKIQDPRKVSRIVRLYDTVNLIGSPKTKRDEINRKKMLAFIEDVRKAKDLDTGLMLRLWKKQRITNQSSYRNKHLQDIITHYSRFEYDTKNQRYFYKE